jgi:hypothetical protein
MICVDHKAYLKGMLGYYSMLLAQIDQNKLNGLDQWQAYHDLKMKRDLAIGLLDRNLLSANCVIPDECVDYGERLMCGHKPERVEVDE